MLRINLLIFLSFYLAISAFSQDVRIKGIVLDQEGNPVSQLTVYIPYTSKGTTSNEKGEYSLEGLPVGDIELSFRHVAYVPVIKSFFGKAGSSYKLNVVVERNTFKISEIIKRADQANWEFGWEKFKDHVLGDPFGRFCTVENPKDLYFYYDGKRLTGHATKPLAIINDYLGYKLVYFLDYFWFEEDKLLPDDPVSHISFAFSGSAFYVDRMEDFWLRKRAWKRNRKNEFKGTLRHFLLSAFYDQIEEQGYVVKQAWSDSKELQESEDISPALAYARFHEMNKVFYWDPSLKKSGYLHYTTRINYPIMSKLSDLNQVPPAKSIQLDDRLLIFHFWDKNHKMAEARLSYMKILPDGSVRDPKLIINDQGNYTLKGATLIWNYLDNQTHLVTALPADYTILNK